MKRSLTARTALCALRGGCALLAGGFAALALNGASYAQADGGAAPLPGVTVNAEAARTTRQNNLNKSITKENV